MLRGGTPGRNVAVHRSPQFGQPRNSGNIVKFKSIQCPQTKSKILMASAGVAVKRAGCSDEAGSQAGHANSSLKERSNCALFLQAAALQLSERLQAGSSRFHLRGALSTKPGRNWKAGTVAQSSRPF